MEGPKAGGQRAVALGRRHLSTTVVHICLLATSSMKHPVLAPNDKVHIPYLFDEMSLNDLPAELTAEVIWYLRQLPPNLCVVSSEDFPKIGGYASISRNFQFEVEQHTFAHLRITSGDLPRFEEAVSQCPRRLANLTGLVFTPLIQAYDGTKERAADYEADSSTFDAAVRRLFTALKVNDHDARPVRYASP